jgi:hypothetical protein
MLSGFGPQIAELQAKLRVNEAARSAVVDKNEMPGPEGLGLSRRQMERTEDFEQRKKNTADLIAHQRNQRIFEAATSAQFGREEGRREITPFEFGRDETQKLLNKREGIGQKLGELEGKENLGMSDRARQLELEQQLLEANYSLRNRSFEVERDINQLMVTRGREFRNSLMEAGPAEMLRKMVAMKMAGDGKMTMAQFLTLSPAMREDVRKVDPRFDPSMMDLRREQGRQGNTGMANYRREVGEYMSRPQGSMKEVIGLADSGMEEAALRVYAQQRRFKQLTTGDVNYMTDIGMPLSVIDDMTGPQKAVTKAWNARNTPGSGAQTPSAFEKGQMEISKVLVEMATALKKAVPDTATYDAAVSNLNRLGDAAGRAADRLDKIGNGGGQAAPTTQVGHGGQFRGTGGAAGRTAPVAAPQPGRGAGIEG